MSNFSLTGMAAQAAELARLVGQLQGPTTKMPGSTGPIPKGGPSFGDFLMQLQQSLTSALPAPIANPLKGLILPQLTMPSVLPALQLPGPSTASSRTAPLEDLIVNSAPQAEAQTSTSVPPATGFGHWEMRSEQRPYSWLSDDKLDFAQRPVVERWKQNPFSQVWVYDVQPTAENNWAGWGSTARGMEDPGCSRAGHQGIPSVAAPRGPALELESGPGRSTRRVLGSASTRPDRKLTAR